MQRGVVEAIPSEIERKVLEIGRLEDIIESHIERQAQQVRPSLSGACRA